MHDSKTARYMLFRVSIDKEFGHWYEPFRKQVDDALENDYAARLATIPEEVKNWTDYNFPNATHDQPLFGMLEELGELAHHHLKSQQDIRGNKAYHRAQAADAIADMFVYLVDYCNRNKFDLFKTIYKTWKEVEKRDWIKYPETGLPPGQEQKPLWLTRDAEGFLIDTE